MSNDIPSFVKIRMQKVDKELNEDGATRLSEYRRIIQRADRPLTRYIDGGLEALESGNPAFTRHILLRPIDVDGNLIGVDVEYNFKEGRDQLAGRYQVPAFELEAPVAHVGLRRETLAEAEWEEFIASRHAVDVDEMSDLTDAYFNDKTAPFADQDRITEAVFFFIGVEQAARLDWAVFYPDDRDQTSSSLRYLFKAPSDPYVYSLSISRDAMVQEAALVLWGFNLAKANNHPSTHLDSHE